MNIHPPINVLVTALRTSFIELAVHNYKYGGVYVMHVVQIRVVGLPTISKHREKLKLQGEAEHF